MHRVLAIVAVTVIRTACGTKEETAPRQIVALDRAFEAPQGIAAGMRHIIFENRGSEIHEAMCVQFAAGHERRPTWSAVKSGALFPQGAIVLLRAGTTVAGANRSNSG